MTIEFFVAGEPKGQPRPRACIRGGHAAVYDSSTAEGWKGLIALAARPFLPKTPLTGAIRVDLTFRFPRPKSHFRTGRLAGCLREDVPHWHTGKPDRDNLDKAVLDILTQIGFWEDDCQVACGLLMKVYDKHGSCGCEIRIQPMEEQEGEGQIKLFPSGRGVENGKHAGGGK